MKSWIRILAAVATLLIAQVGRAQPNSATEGSEGSGNEEANNKPSDDSLQSQLAPWTQFRCKVALCWGGDNRYAIEPVLDIPVNLIWAAGHSALTDYINSNVVNLEFNAGLRFWFAHDIASIAVFISRPVIKSNEPIRVDGSDFSHSPSAVHRSYPSLGLGFFGDVLLIGVAYDVLRNGASEENQDPNYPPNAVLSRSLTFSLGFSFLNMARNQVGKTETETKKAEKAKANGGQTR